MTTLPIFTANIAQVDASGDPYAGALLYFYIAATTTPVTVYQDNAAGTPHLNPVVADTDGSFAPIFVPDGLIKVVHQTALGVTIRTIDGIVMGTGGVTALVLQQSTTPAPTAEGDTWWDTNDDRFAVGNGATTSTFSNDVANAAAYLGAAAIATPAQYLANTSSKIVGSASLATAGSEVALTDASTIALDMATFLNASVTLAGNRTLGNPTNTLDGRSGRIRLVQDATGSRALAYSSHWKFAGGVAPVLTTTAAAYDLLYYDVISSSIIFGSLNKAVA